eukprot:186031-Heterocapsa_arctica.AAC.1
MPAQAATFGRVSSDASSIGHGSRSTTPTPGEPSGSTIAMAPGFPPLPFVVLTEHEAEPPPLQGKGCWRRV